MANQTGGSITWQLDVDDSKLVTGLSKAKSQAADTASSVKKSISSIDFKSIAANASTAFGNVADSMTNVIKKLAVLSAGSGGIGTLFELGKTTDECGCSNIDEDNLQDPDAVVYAYRTYLYNEKDRYLFTDPFTAVHKVKLVKDGVTVKTFTTDEYTVSYGQDGLAKFIDVNCRDCLCVCNCKSCVQLAVDATWAFETIPTDLLYVQADMVTYYADCKTDVKSETLGTHSYTKFDRREPEYLDHNLAVIKKYAGPYGSVTRVVTV